MIDRDDDKKIGRDSLGRTKSTDVTKFNHERRLKNELRAVTASLGVVEAMTPESWSKIAVTTHGVSHAEMLATLRRDKQRLERQLERMGIPTQQQTVPKIEVKKEFLDAWVQLFQAEAALAKLQNESVPASDRESRIAKLEREIHDLRTIVGIDVTSDVWPDIQLKKSD